MASEWIELLLRANVALAAGVAVVMALRPLVRQHFGARIGYALWVLPLAAAAMCFTPARVEHVVLEPIIAPVGRAAPAVTGAAEAIVAQPPYLLWAWIAGAIISVVVLAMRQARFTSALGRLSKREDLGQHVRGAESCEHGPAVIGVLRPIIVTPADFDQRFDAEERRIVLAHERAHMAQGDPWINALVVLLQCVNWFNPFVHVAARALRVDQELACDAAVLAQSDGLRRRYAEAILKTHIAAAAPIGCSWPPSDLNALKERISMLKRNLPSRTQTLIGGAAVIAITAGVAAAAWAAQPTRVVTTIATSQEAPATVMLAGAETETTTEATADMESLEALHALASLESLESLGSLEALASLESLSALSALEALPADHDLEGGGVRVMRDGRAVRYEDLSPEERAEVRRELAEAREHIREAREASEEARQRAAEARAMAQQAREAARAARHDDHREAEREAREAHLEALQEEREARAEAAQIQAEVMAEVRIAMAEVERELAQLGPQERAYARDALREAHTEIARELRDARRRGDADEIQALEAAEQALRGAAHD